MVVVGVDEAGRGPVLGPLVICAYAVEESELPGLKKAGVKDSKLLTHEKRMALVPLLLEKGTAALEIITAEEITALMRKKISLNEIEAQRGAEAIKKVMDGASCVYVDSPDPIPRKFANRLYKYLPQKLKIVSENKADYKYVVVGAASVIAKEKRDEEIDAIKRELKCDFGNGYSHDEATIHFLTQHKDDPRLQKYIRHEWATAKRICGKGKQTKLM
ncbi:Ribonuclease HII [Candidatus Norongarragalina meridionalis]|nr:Ribonuclease HII [Candidatus Norongarragalina meridionalis]